MSRKPKEIKVILDQLTDNRHVLKGSYGDYYVYRKDWLLEHLEDEFCLLEMYRASKKVTEEEKEKIFSEIEKINKTPYSTKINQELGILGE